jgi:membrane-bound lytic murein transglycosylase D
MEMRGKVRELIALSSLLALVAGCAGVGPTTSTDQGLTVVGQTTTEGWPTVASSGVAADQAPSGQATISSLGSLPFVRNQPVAAAPFPLVLNRTVQSYVDKYLDQPEGLVSSFRRSNPYMAQMVAELRQQGLPKDLVYLTFAESAFTDSGAGPWQLSHATARRYGLKINSWIDERRDPIKSTRAAAAYLATLHEQVGNDWCMTLVAWNNGESGVDRYRQLADESYERMVTRLPHRTRELLNRFMAVAMIARHSHEYGIAQANYGTTPGYQVVEVGG